MDSLSWLLNIPVLLCILPVCSPCETLNLTLEEALRLSESRSIEFHSDEAALRIAQSAYMFELRSFLPSLSLTYAGNRSVTRGGPDSGEHQISLHFNQLLFNGGRGIRKLKLHRKVLRLQSSDLAAKRDYLRDDVWRVFQEIAMLRERYKLQENSLQLAVDLMQIVEMKFNQGAITELDHIQGRLTLQETEQSLEETEMDLHIKELRFLVLLGLPPDTKFELTGETFIDYNGADIPFEQDELYRIALENNRDLRRSAFSIQQQESAGRALKWKAFPTISLIGTIEVSGFAFPLSSPLYSLSLALQFPETTSPSALSAGMQFRETSKRALSASLNISPFEQTAPLLEERQHHTGLNILKEQHQRNIENLRYSIGEALGRHHHLLRQISLIKSTVVLRRREYDLLKLKWRLGEARQSQVVEAHTGLASREIELLMKILEMKLAERELERLAGLPPGTFNRISQRMVQ